MVGARFLLFLFPASELSLFRGTAIVSEDFFFISTFLWRRVCSESSGCAIYVWLECGGFLSFCGSSRVYVGGVESLRVGVVFSFIFGIRESAFV